MKVNVLLIVLFSTFSVVAQTKKAVVAFNPSDYPSTGYRISSDTTWFGSLQIVRTMVHPRNTSTAKFHCRSWLTIQLHHKVLTQKFYDIEPVGGCSGLYVPKEQPCRGYFILSKFGDYQGETLLIDSSGKLTVIKGGSFSITKDKHYLFTLYDSDVSGMSVYDLNLHKLVWSREAKGEVRYNDFFMQDGKYYVSFSNEENLTQVGLMDFKSKQIQMQKKSGTSSNPSYKLTMYNDVQDLEQCNCGE